MGKSMALEAGREMLARTAAEMWVLKPGRLGLAKEFGLHNNGYRLSDVQAQRILEMHCSA
jgi:hypothetical protein